MSHPKSLDNVSAYTKANIYFEGKVISHTLITEEGAKVTLGLIYPGQFHFGTAKAERMDIVSGSCLVKMDGSKDVITYAAGSTFTVPPNSGFDIEVKEGICEYICSFLD